MTSTKYIGMDVHKESISIAVMNRGKDRDGMHHRDESQHDGFGLEGGNRNFFPKTTDSVATIEPLVKALRLSFTKRAGGGFYLRVESFFNVASYVDQLGASGSYGDKSLHDQSHGESFLSLLQNRFTRSGFYLMDEPEAALSPQRQLSFLILLHDW